MRLSSLLLYLRFIDQWCLGLQVFIIDSGIREITSYWVEYIDSGEKRCLF